MFFACQNLQKFRKCAQNCIFSLLPKIHHLTEDDNKSKPVVKNTLKRLWIRERNVYKKNIKISFYKSPLSSLRNGHKNVLFSIIFHDDLVSIFNHWHTYRKGVVVFFVHPNFALFPEWFQALPCEDSIFENLKVFVQFIQVKGSLIVKELRKISSSDIQSARLRHWQLKVQKFSNPPNHQHNEVRQIFGLKCSLIN